MMECCVYMSQDVQAANQDMACADDRQIVALIWAHIEQLLNSGQGADATVRQLTAVLPSLDPVPTQELPALAHLHLNSAGHLMATIRLLVPDAFKDSTTEPNITALLSVSGPAAGMVSTLIELQLFHLNRAKDVTAHMRARIAHRRATVQRQMQSLVTTSSSSGCTDEEMVQSLE